MIGASINEDVGVMMSVHQIMWVCGYMEAETGRPQESPLHIILCVGETLAVSLPPPPLFHTLISSHPLYNVGVNAAFTGGNCTLGIFEGES